ncbi:MAG: hypothetical protein AABX63_03090 [Nanoarchaeota archaeon]
MRKQPLVRRIPLPKVDVAVVDATLRIPANVVEPISEIVKTDVDALLAMLTIALPVRARSSQTEKGAYGEDVPTETRPDTVEEASMEKIGAPVNDVAKEKAFVAAGIVEVEEEA